MASRQVLNSCLLVLSLSVTCNFRVEKMFLNVAIIQIFYLNLHSGTKCHAGQHKAMLLVTNSLTDVSNQL